MPSFSELQQLASYVNIALPIIIAISILLLCIFNVDKLILLNGLIAGMFVKVSSSARKAKVANRIRGQAMAAVKSLGMKDSEFLPKDVKIQWVKDETREAF